MTEQQLIESVQQKLVVRLQSQYNGLAAFIPFEQYLTALNGHHALIGYTVVDKKISKLCAKIVHEFSSDALDLYHRILLLDLLLNNQREMQLGQYTDAIKQMYQKECLRIVQDVEQNQIGFYNYTNDLFCKDMAIASLRMFPAGVLKVESEAGIPRSMLLRNKGKDLFSWIRFITTLGGFNPFYEIHLDLRYRVEFTPDGWNYALRLTGEMLNIYPQIKGITGASWFFDPQIREISPRLTYLRQSIEENGGKFFFYKRDDHTTELAISASFTRRNLYKSGQYKPASYFMVWPRKEILHWINRM